MISNQNKNIEMVDLKRQYNRFKSEIDDAIASVMASAAFVKGPVTAQFEKNLSNYLNGVNVISCGNGTDALQIALMALELEIGDEIIVPSFTFIASAEVIALLGLKPVFVDVDPITFNIDPQKIEEAITSRTKAIIPVHLYGQCAPMEEIMAIAKSNNLYVVEDTCQALGADYLWQDGPKEKAGTIGHIGCTSFFPSKPLGCYGDGGALFTKDASLAKRIRAISNHGMEKRYHHDIVGVNSRLDAIQAAILDVKLKYLNDFTSHRQWVAKQYTEQLEELKEVITPTQSSYSTHVFHQYTLKVDKKDRDNLMAFLKTKEIPSMIYYPIPLHLQKAFKNSTNILHELEVSEHLSNCIISIPIHTELETNEIGYITSSLKEFFSKL